MNIKFFFLVNIISFVVAQSALSKEQNNEFVVGNNFKIPATQQIKYVSLLKIDPSLFLDNNIPRLIDLRSKQSKVKSQGKRGACTYFAFTSLVEGIIMQKFGKDIDLSEEYLAWAAKTKLKMRAMEEDSSVAVNAATFQQFGFMLEKDLPYQQSWFDKGLPCEEQKGKDNIDPICFAHDGPTLKNSDRIISGDGFIFEAVDSRSIDVVRSLARFKNPVTLSILGHKDMWDQTYKTGDLILTKKWKEDCQNFPKHCGGHAVLIVGYDLDKRVFFIKNSWGEKWGQKGYGTISFDFIDQMSSRKFLTGFVVESSSTKKMAGRIRRV